MDTYEQIVAALRRVGYDYWAACAAARGEMSWNNKR